MLGPSGSGKTTTLRMIAGFELPTAGRILLHGADVTAIPPFDRDVNTVFQDYALFPHMTVGDNVAYGLVVRKVPKADRLSRVDRGAPDGAPRGLREAQAEPALGRPAAAGRPRPGPGQSPARAAPRRAARRARPQAPRGDADRAEGDPAGGRHHLHLRDPRPGRGAHDERPAGRLQPGPDRADRRAGRGLRATRDRGSWPASSGRPTCCAARPRERILGSAGHVHDPAREDPAGRPGRDGRTRRDVGDRASSAASSTSAPTPATSSPSTRAAELVVTQQNLSTSSTEALAQEGKAVRLVWKRQHQLPIADGA